MPYGLVASKLDITNIFDGCLNVLRNELTSKLPEGKQWTQNAGIKALVGSAVEHDVYPYPFIDDTSMWFEIYFGNKWILPFAYSLMGRRAYNGDFLKSWNFSGLNRNNKWVLLHNETNKPFYQNENRTFLLKGNEAYKGFKIEMTESNSDGKWSLCLGQIDVFGNIYRSYFIPKNGVFECTTMKHFFVNNFILFLNFIS